MLKWIGLDDTDSYSGGCTTWIATRLLIDNINNVLDFPYLIRLNPEIPWKTRGNGALALKLRITDEDAELRVKDFILKNSRMEGKTSPGIIICRQKIALDFFADKTLKDIVTKRLLENALSQIQDAEIYFIDDRKRGLIGAIAAVSHQWKDYTYELIAYRSDPGNERAQNLVDVLYLDSFTSPITFLNFDREEGKPLIYPHGPDPVLFGIRGEDPNVLMASFNLISNRAQMWAVFKTNQATNEHIIPITELTFARPYTTVSLTVYLIKEPQIVRGGHVILQIKDAKGNSAEAIVYRQTVTLNRAARELMPGDKLFIWGAVRPDARSLTINIHGFRPISLVQMEYSVPKCPLCGRSMRKTNMATFECERCKTKSHAFAVIPLKRQLLEGKDYLPSPSSFKHLMKPWSRRPLQLAFKYSSKYYGSRASRS